MKNLIFYCIFILIVLGILISYFIKCQLDICLIKDFPLDKIPPFSLLQNRNPYHIINSPDNNIDLFSNKYAFIAGIGKWNDLWMHDKGMVILNVDTKGHNGRSCFVITNSSAHDWALEHKRLIQVKQGEVYAYSGLVKISGNSVVSELSIILYDKDKQVKKWDYAEESIIRANLWDKVENKFVVPIGVRYIRFHITGQGVGKTWFDEIKFMKL